MKSHITKIGPGVLFLLFAFFAPFTYGQSQFSLNVNLLGHWDDNTLPQNSGVTYNDVWGYAANGREYGIFGSIEGTYFFDITVPTNPIELYYFPGAYNNAIWRDIKVYGTHAYSVADAGASTLQIFDLSGLPGTVTKVYDANTLFTRAHNIFINENNGRLYVAGANNLSNGIKVFDLTTNPANPILLGDFNLGTYSHDVYVRNDTVYCFMGNSGLQVWDFTNLGSVNQIGSLSTYPEQGYCHQGYGFKAGGTHLVWTDETHDTGLKVADVSDNSNISVTSVFRSGLLAPTFTDNIPHNVYMKGDIAYISYYHDGLQIYDLSDPFNPVQLGYYDTDSTPFYFGFNGLWGVYPYLPSGNIIGTDVLNGFFIWNTGNLFPVEFGSISAELVDKTVQLDWETQSETNNSHFVVERSGNGHDFSILEEVAGAGTTTELQLYSVLDDDPLNGENYYRVKQIDLNGDIAYSQTITVNVTEDFALTGFYPNPVKGNGNLNVTLNLFEDEQVYISIQDIMGKEVRAWYEFLSAGVKELHLPLNQLVPGTYVVQMSGSRTKLTEKIIVQ